jgi:hypothetical protein
MLYLPLIHIHSLAFCGGSPLAWEAVPCSLKLTIKANSARNAPFDVMNLREEVRPKIARTSATLPEVPLQASELVALTGECPRSVRVLESAKHGS